MTPKRFTFFLMNTTPETQPKRKRSSHQAALVSRILEWLMEEYFRTGDMRYWRWFRRLEQL